MDTINEILKETLKETLNEFLHFPLKFSSKIFFPQKICFLLKYEKYQHLLYYIEHDRVSEWLRSWF